MSPGEEAALQTFSTDDPLQATRRTLLNDTMQGKYVDATTNPNLRGYIEAAQRPTLEGLEHLLSRVLPGRFAMAGQSTQPGGSSAFDRAAGDYSIKALREMGDIATKIAYPAYEAERGRQQEGIQLGQQEVQTMVSNLQASALPRLIQQQGIENGIAQFNETLKALLQALGIATNAPLVSIASEQKGTKHDQTGVLPALGSFYSGYNS
jgi:hypothetical protein